MVFQSRFPLKEREMGRPRFIADSLDFCLPPSPSKPLLASTMNFNLQSRMDMGGMDMGSSSDSTEAACQVRRVHCWLQGRTAR